MKDDVYKNKNIITFNRGFYQNIFDKFILTSEKNIVVSTKSNYLMNQIK